jgi:hypothetical protein
MPEFISESDNAAVALLNDLPLWRLRAIERVELSQAFWSERERTIHVQPLREVAKRDGSPHRIAPFANALTPLGIMHYAHADLVLPIAELPKVPLLDLDIAIDGAPAYRLSRDEGARIQAYHILDLALHAGLLSKDNYTPQLVDFLTFIFYYPWYDYARIRHAFTPPIFSVPDRTYLTTHSTHIEEYQSLNIPLHYGAWTDISNSIAKLSRKYVLKDAMSGSQNPLLSLPYLFQELKDRDDNGNAPDYPDSEKITFLLAWLNRSLHQADEMEGTDEATQCANRFISDYYSYGYRWMVFARCKVPSNAPFTMTLREKRAIYFTPYRHTKPSFANYIRKEAWQNIAFADAETNHVSIRVSDVAVRIKHRPQALDELLEPLDNSNPRPHYPDEEESTFELYMRESSKRDRLSRIYIRCPLRLTRVQSGMLWLTIFITGFAWILLLIRGIPAIYPAVHHFWDDSSNVDSGLTAKDATLILVPVAFAATLLLSKLDSTLSAWIRRIRHAVLLVELFGVLATAFVLVLISRIKSG